MIETLEGFPANVVAVRGHGRISGADYENVLVPAVEKALAAHDKVRVYYEIADDFEGYAPAAMWEDFSVGMKHLTHWDRVAVVTDVPWIAQAMGFFRFMMPIEIKAFPTGEARAAKAWIAAV